MPQGRQAAGWAGGRVGAWQRDPLALTLPLVLLRTSSPPAHLAAYLAAHLAGR